jgi:putative ABC transport system permease protein
MVVVGAAASWPQVNYVKLDVGRSFADYEIERRRRVVVLGNSAADALFKNIDPLGKRVRIGREEYTVIGVLAKRPRPLGGDADQLAVIPVSTYEKMYPPQRIRGYLLSFRMILAVPAEGASRERLMTEMEQIIRARHRLKLDQENDFDILTADSIMAILDQLTRAVALALVVISSIALMVGGIGVMAIMTISVTERTREIGVRKALGARRREILWQFLVEAVVLTSVGGVLGILVGSGIGFAVNRFAGFPVSLPLWSFALGLGFSAAVGIFFGMFPAIKASRLDPIEALRYE